MAALHIRTLNNEFNFFNFLERPRTLEAITEHFGFQNIAYVKIILDTFVKHGYLEKNVDLDMYTITNYYRVTE